MSTFTSPIKAKDDHKIKSFKMKSAVIIIHYTVWFFFEKKYAYCKSSSSYMLKLNKYKYFYCCNVLSKVKCTCNK